VGSVYAHEGVVGRRSTKELYDDDRAAKEKAQPRFAGII
jgi:hypothetical protein